MKHLIENLPSLSTIGKATESEKKTGKQLSEIGLEKIKSFAVTSPQENDKSLKAMLKSMLKSQLNLKTKTVFTENGADFKETVEFKDLDIQQRQDVNFLLAGYLRPLPTKTITEGLARLQVICPERERTGVDKQFRLKIYIEELSKYPADIVMDCLKKKYKWFPSLAELLDFCDDKMVFRKLVKRGLR